jgi:hypothetical protein
VNSLITLLCLSILLLATSCALTPWRNPQASQLAAGQYPGGHCIVETDNSLRVLLGFEEILIGSDGQERQRQAYGMRPMQLPDQNYAADHQLLEGPEDWLGTCRRDGYLEVWRNPVTAGGFSRIGEQYTPLGIWLPGQYPPGEYCALLDNQVLSTGRDQSLSSFDYDGREQWNFLMGAPARLLATVGSEQVHAASADGWLYALDLQGALLWQHETASQLAALLPDGNIVCVSRSGALLCLDQEGREIWQHALDREPEELRCSGDLIWYAAEGRLHCITAAGRPMASSWNDKLALRDLVPGPDGRIYVSAFPRPPSGSAQALHEAWWPLDGTLYCYDADARLLWEYPRLRTGYSIVPAYNGQCWLIDFDPFTFGNQHSMLLIGQRTDSVGS